MLKDKFEINKTEIENGGLFIEVEVPKEIGICAKSVNIELDKDKKIRDLAVIGGCAGNLNAVANLIKGMSIEEVINKLDGIICGRKSTSCPNEIANILGEIYE